MDENLNDTRKSERETINPEKSKFPTQAKIIICCLFFIIIGLVITIILFFLIFKKKEENNNEDDFERERLEKAGYFEIWNDLFGIRMQNLSYARNDIIVNSFKKGGDNYNDSIGEINNGKDYPKNERNIYTLYIPYSSLKETDKYNGIILYIHGGAWISGYKEDVEFLCSRYSKMGYITATMGYTILTEEYEQYNIYRIVDEINACIESIKDELVKFGFNSNKLELAVGGISAGAHLALLYGYSIKKSPLKIKFLINIVGPLSLEKEFWYQPAKYNETLENLENESVGKAIKDEKIEKIYDDSNIIELMNLFLGNIYSEEDMRGMIVDNKINKNNTKFKEMYQKVQNSFPIIFVNNDTLPTLCEYAGNDTYVGVSHYRFLTNLSDKYDNKLDIVYMRYANHGLVSYDTENGIKAMRDMHNLILKYADTYFTSNK